MLELDAGVRSGELPVHGDCHGQAVVGAFLIPSPFSDLPVMASLSVR